jgi:hypothetical protein
MENIWQFMRDNWLSNRVFRNHDDIIDRCCHWWNRLISQPWHAKQAAAVLKLEELSLA